MRKAVLFEPPLDVDGSQPTDWLARFDREIATGRTPAALVTGMKASRLGPPMLNAVPRPVLVLLTSMMLKREDKGAANGSEPTFRELAPSLHCDGQVAAETAGNLAAYQTTRAEVLLLGGTKSPAHLRAALTALEGVLPHARRVELEGLDHSATSNTARRGAPRRVATEIRRFLLPG